MPGTNAQKTARTCGLSRQGNQFFAFLSSNCDIALTTTMASGRLTIAMSMRVKRANDGAAIEQRGHRREYRI
jgi:hypothetical protein